MEVLPNGKINCWTISTPAIQILILETVLKASAALSGEIILPKLLKKMMQIIMENAGAQNGFLIMEKDGEKFVEAEIKADNEDIKILQSIPVSGSEILAESVVSYVYLTQETVILDDAVKVNFLAMMIL